MVIPDLSFDKISSLPMPMQNVREWQIYLGIIETYFRNKEIKNPIVVEIGIHANKQKKFYEEILGYKHIGIDKNLACKPDILGDSKDSATVNKLKEKLNGEPINLLFIDGNHGYATAKSDYEIYGGLTKNIIVLHDVVSYRHNHFVGRFWNELIEDRNVEMQDRTFITIRAWRSRIDNPDIAYGGTGTGIIIIGIESERKYIGEEIEGRKRIFEK